LPEVGRDGAGALATFEAKASCLVDARPGGNREPGRVLDDLVDDHIAELLEPGAR